ncbi:MAG: hypothetical protein ACREIO_00260 [Nitrospiraceae bacterium]
MCRLQGSLISVKLVTLALMILPATVLMQGCMLALWLGAVGIDSTRSSEVEFQPFEHSWVAPLEQWPQPDAMRSLAVAPFGGETTMATLLAAALQQETDLRIVSPSEVTTHGSPELVAGLSGNLTEEDGPALAEKIAAEFEVDCVLLGRAVGGQPQWSFWGLKERYPKRLFIHLVDAKGTLMWKDELPFTIVKGAKEIDETWVKQALLARVMARVTELGLADVWLTLKKKASLPGAMTLRADRAEKQ